MANLRQSARGRECQVRLENICNFDKDTTVLAHYRMIGISGLAYKSADIWGSFACFNCHQVCDAPENFGMEREFVQLAHLRGVIRTQAIWLEEGLIAIADRRAA